MKISISSRKAMGNILYAFTAAIVQSDILAFDACILKCREAEL
jgi:hypothetical protein